jgi:hypothetical protein
MPGQRALGDERGHALRQLRREAEHVVVGGRRHHLFQVGAHGRQRERTA